MSSVSFVEIDVRYVVENSLGGRPEGVGGS
jgi:hypothetical protein